MSTLTPPELPHCVGHVTFTRDQTDRLARRLAIALVGEVDRREELLRMAGVTNLDDYRRALTMRTDIELCQPPGADDNDAFGLDYAELSAVQAPAAPPRLVYIG